ncbi:MAG: hypothetical protein ACF788_02005, partial [Novipirellula sp. JB048]
MQDPFEWLDALTFASPEMARQHVQQIWQSGVADDRLATLQAQWIEQFTQLDDPDATLQWLAEMITAAAAPESLLELFHHDPQALPTLLKILATSPSLRSRLIADPHAFESLYAQRGQALDRASLLKSLRTSISGVDDFEQASQRIREFL